MNVMFTIKYINITHANICIVIINKHKTGLQIKETAKWNNRFIDINIFIYCRHMGEGWDRHTKRKGGSEGEGFASSVGPTICYTYQVCGVHMVCKTIHFMGQSSVIGPHIEAEVEAR